MRTKTNEENYNQHRICGSQLNSATLLTENEKIKVVFNYFSEYFSFNSSPKEELNGRTFETHLGTAGIDNRELY